MSGTDLGYAASRTTHAGDAPYAWQGSAHQGAYARPDLVLSAICLSACYAMSGSDLAYSATGHCGICLRACYAMSGTDLVYAPTRPCLLYTSPSPRDRG
eukprot:1438386-Rhodomonas_salina.1